MEYYLSTLKNALAYVEPMLPPIFGPQAQPGEKQIGNLKNVTDMRRNFISPSYFEPMLDKFETEVDGLDDVEPPSATSPAVDEEDDEPEPGEPYGCDDDMQDLLIEFYQSLHKFWPVDCEVPHKLMLRLVPRRQYVGGDHKAKVLELDTLSSWHDQRWGRIVYHVRKRNPPLEQQASAKSKTKVRFAGDLVDTGDEASEPGPRKHSGPFNGSPSQLKLDRNDVLTLCRLIKKSGEEMKCLRVDLDSLECIAPLGERGISSKKLMKPLHHLLPPMRMTAEAIQPQQQTTQASHLTPEQKAEIGLVLACSLLQFSKGQWVSRGQNEPGPLARKAEGGWLSRDWNNAEHGICFLPGYKKIDTSAPYLPVIFDPASNTAQQEQEQGEQSGFVCHPPSLLALAITLVQLQNKDVINELDLIWEDLLEEMEDDNTPNTDRYTRARILEWNALDYLLEQNTFQTWVDEKCKMAIEACLKGEFVRSLEEQDEVTAKKLFYAKVVKPLAEHYHRTLQKPSAIPDPGVQKGPGHNQPLNQSTTEDSRDDLDGEEGDDILPQRAAFMTGQAANPRKWLDNLKQLSTVINGMQAKCTSKTISRPAPIRVAILDTGLDLKRKFFQARARRARIKEIADFVRDPGGTFISKPSIDPEATGIDTFGHGSLMAQFLMEAAPLADIYIARVAADTDSLASSKKTIVQAIEWATRTHKVDVISMSFGFPETDKAIANIITSVQPQGGDPVVFLASAGNSSYEREKFPAYQHDVLSIRATDCDGTFLTKKPPQDCERPGLVFGAYGHNIPERISSEYDDNICQPGSSIATAIAAAIAAIMLAYVESLPFTLASEMQDEIIKQELGRLREELQDLEKLRTVEGMSLLFNRMAPDKASRSKERWVCPVWFFGEDRTHHVARKEALLEVARSVRSPAPPSRQSLPG
ncbi:hypothetical protein QBC43DRAFT_242957 [Cladorrhinum sp. PSN259]|nr:hypothetical protein QBC43DRAFT_242957 [Cladorrhinum sp. PSN259]